MTVELNDGLGKFKTLLMGKAIPQSVGTITTEVKNRIEEWTPQWSGKHSETNVKTPWKGHIEYKYTTKEGRIESHIYFNHPSPHGIWNAEYGRAPMRREKGIPIKKSGQEAQNLLIELKQKRRDWINKFEVPEYMHDAKFVYRNGRREYNPLTSKAEQLLIRENVIIRKSVEGIPASYFITNLMKTEMKDKLIGLLFINIKTAAKQAAASKVKSVGIG